MRDGGLVPAVGVDAAFPAQIENFHVGVEAAARDEVAVRVEGNVPDGGAVARQVANESLLCTVPDLDGSAPVSRRNHVVVESELDGVHFAAVAHKAGDGLHAAQAPHVDALVITATREDTRGARPEAHRVDGLGVGVELAHLAGLWLEGRHGVLC